MQPILEVVNLTMTFGGLRAIDEVCLEVFPKEIVALIGPNGAGKTTFFNCVTGIYNPTAGDILIHPEGEQKTSIKGFKSNQVAAAGIARTFQNIRLFPGMTALENVMVGQHCRTRTGILGAILQGSKAVKEEKRVIEKSYHLIEMVRLEKYVNNLAKNLPYAAQRRLEIARALATDPFLLLLDEPAAGMNPQETNELDALITRIRDQNQIAILLIEHDMKLVMRIAEKIVVVDYGKKIAQGSAQEIQKDKNVIKAYLGEDLHVET